MLWDQRVVGSNPISPTTNPTVSDTSAPCDVEQTGNDWKRADAIGRSSPGIVTDGLDDSGGSAHLIKHTGHGCPVARDVIVTVTLRNGNVRSGHRADYWDWWHSDHPADVMLYQVEPRP